MSPEEIIDCDSPQYLIGGGITPCGLCLSCGRKKDAAERQRRFYWLKKNRRNAHESKT